MAFTNKFKTLGEVLLAYQLRYEQADFKFTHKRNAPRKFVEELKFDLKEIPFDASEATLREVIIFPILRLAWKPFSPYLTLWGHKAISADETLSGIPDYIIAKRSNLGSIVFDVPYVAVVEAKMDDFTGGWAQCALEMIAIQKINNQPDLPVFGIVTNGELWQFAQLEKNLLTEYKQVFILENLNSLLSALTTMLEFYKSRLPQLVEQN